MMRSQMQRAKMLLAVAAILAGCSTVQVSQDYDPTLVAHRNQTWQWGQANQPVTGDLRVDNPLLNNRIRRAIESHLADRHIKQDRQHPDLYISYHLVIQQKIQSYSSYPTFGVGYYYYPWSWSYDADVHVYQYDECQLTIDVKAADTNALIWRGTGVYRYKTYKTPYEAAKDMQRTVDQILSQFPPVES